MRRTPLVLAAVAVTGLLAACDPHDVVPTGPTGATCIVDNPNCDDMSFGHSATEDDATGLIGLAQADLPDDVRIARIGDEPLPLIDDYVVGRLTVELDPDASGTPRVVQVVLETDDGPLTVR